MSRTSLIVRIISAALICTVIACESLRTLDRGYRPEYATRKGHVSVELNGDTGVLRARVVAENDERLAAAPEVLLVPIRGGSAIVGDESFTVASPRGRFRLVARATGYIPADTVLSLPSDRGAALTVRLPSLRFAR
jgi:hypothetical protein